MGNQYYKYGGTDFDAHEPWPEPIPRRGGRHVLTNPAKCGTLGGYSKHRREGTTLCEPCYASNRAYNSEWKRRKKLGKVTTGWVEGA